MKIDFNLLRPSISKMHLIQTIGLLKDKNKTIENLALIYKLEIEEMKCVLIVTNTLELLK